MRDRGFDVLLAISSVNGQKSTGRWIAATKAGDIGIIRSLAQEGTMKGITANAVCPGYIGQNGQGDPEKVLNEIIANPAGRLGGREEITRAWHLASDDAASSWTNSGNGAQFFS